MEEHTDNWAMPMVLRCEKHALPSRLEALHAAAHAVLGLCHDPRRSGDWAPAFEAWLDGRFRKVARRARGSKWDAALQLPGVTATVGRAEVRAYPPCLNSQLPDGLRKLQVSGTDLPDEAFDGPHAEVQFMLNPRVTMSTGKAMAQIGHAVMILEYKLGDDGKALWAERDWALQITEPSQERWDDVVEDAYVKVHDAGFTEVSAGSLTVIGLRPEFLDRG